MNILIFGGTTEGRLLARRLRELGHQVAVSVATPLGAEELSSIPGLQVLVGRREAGEMARLVQGWQLCVDATHPYAREASRNIRLACQAGQVPLRRLLREESPARGCVEVDSCAQAAEYLTGRPGNVLLATGAKELSAFAPLDPSRLFARVLPTCQGIQACLDLGLPHRNILALQGPFTRAFNRAMLEQYRIRWLVTKDGGRAGGFEEKLAAAREAGAQVILVTRPPETGVSLEEILREVERSAP